MTTYSRGDVVLVKFPFTNQGGSKSRPAVVISTDQYNQNCPDVMIASVTGNPRPMPHIGDWPIADWQDAGLDAPSIVQTKLVTVEASIILRRVGQLQATDMAQFEAGLRQAMGL